MILRGWPKNQKLRISLFFSASRTDNNLINTIRKVKPLNQDLENQNGRKDIHDYKRKFHRKNIWLNEKSKEYLSTPRRRKL